VSAPLDWQAGFLATSFVGRAIEGGQLAVRARSPREFGLGRHRSVDDTPYGGGSGMVMRVDVLVAAMESLDADAPSGLRGRRVLLTPQGHKLDQTAVARLSAQGAVMLVCGRYEGFDERVRAHVDEELSLGDFVMTGGEVAAMAVIDACVRLLPGVLGNEESREQDSFAVPVGAPTEVRHGLLDCPHYTRPAEFRDWKVPDVLLSGDHQEIRQWRRRRALEKTWRRRPDLLAQVPLSEEDRRWLDSLKGAKL